MLLFNNRLALVMNRDSHHFSSKYNRRPEGKHKTGDQSSHGELDSRRKIEQRQELRELRKQLDDPDYEFNFD